MKRENSIRRKMYHAKLANLEAAMMCNHKRTIPKTFEQSLQKKRDTLKKVEKEKVWEKTQEALKKVESGEPKDRNPERKAKSKRIKTLNEQIKEAEKERTKRDGKSWNCRLNYPKKLETTTSEHL